MKPKSNLERRSGAARPLPKHTSNWEGYACIAGIWTAVSNTTKELFDPEPDRFRIGAYLGQWLPQGQQNRYDQQTTQPGPEVFAHF